jgi:putative glutamine amidotransferase
MPPLIGITTDIVDPGSGKPLKADCSLAYASAIAAAGAVPILLPPIPALADAHASLCHAFVFSGGDDPRTEAFGVPTHPAAKPIHPQRQAYELRLLELLRTSQPRTPVLGVCLGMQMMSLHAGGTLYQHLPESLPTADQHRGTHTILPAAASGLALRPGTVWSNHHQAVQSPGHLRILATSPDGVIEAVADLDRPFYCGVQWHPERTDNSDLGAGIFAQLAAAAGASPRGPQA